MPENNDTLQNQTTEEFEDGAYRKDDKKDELKESEEQIDQLDRDNKDGVRIPPAPVVDDEAEELGLRELGNTRKNSSSPIKLAEEELYRQLGYNADEEGFVSHPVNITGMVSLEELDDEVCITYQVGRENFGKLRSPSLEMYETEEQELGGLLTPTDHVSVETEADEDYFRLEFSYSTDEAVEGGRETAEKLDIVEVYLSS